MPVDWVRDTISDTEGHRLPIHKEYGRVPTTVYSYSNGAEVVVEKVAEGRGKLKEVREVVRTMTPKARFSMNFAPGVYERIFRKGDKGEASG